MSIPNKEILLFLIIVQNRNNYCSKYPYLQILGFDASLEYTEYLGYLVSKANKMIFILKTCLFCGWEAKLYLYKLLVHQCLGVCCILYRILTSVTTFLSQRRYKINFRSTLTIVGLNFLDNPSSQLRFVWGPSLEDQI